MNTAAHTLTCQKLNFIMALDKAIQLIEGALQLYQASNGVAFHRYTVMRLLSDGLERVLKLTIQAHSFNASGAFKSVRKYSHHLDRLLHATLQECFSTSAMEHHGVQADVVFVQTDPVLQVLLPLLCDFGAQGRYYYLDGLTQEPVEDDGSPELRWDNVLDAAAPSREAAVQLTIDGQAHTLIPVIVGSIERLLRCLARSIYFDPTVNKETKSMSSYLMSSFLKIRDADFGTRTYPVFSAP